MRRVSQQFHQLPMFMSAREIRSNYQALDADREDYTDWDDPDEPTTQETDDDLFDRKYEEATVNTFHSPNDSRSLADAIVEDGVKNPISLQVPDLNGSQGKPQILGGHHRVAVMEIYKPDSLMPVEHFRGSGEARRSLGRKY